MHLDKVYGQMIDYAYHTVHNNFILKFIFGIFSSVLFTVVDSHPTMINFIAGFFILDLVTGLMKAFNFKIWSSRAFFKGCTKLFIYCLYLYMGVGIDHAIGFNLVVPMFFGFIILTDAGSILENLEQLGYKTPIPSSLLKSYKKKFIEEKIVSFGLEGVHIDFQEDFKQMKGVYIPMIKGDINRKMFEMKIVILEDFVNSIAKLNTKDSELFKTQFLLLLENTGENLVDILSKANFKSTEINLFLSRHNNRVILLKKEINNIMKEITDYKLTNQMKNNVIQATVRIIYKGISDNVNA